MFIKMLQLVVFYIVVFSVGNVFGQYQSCADCKSIKDCAAATKLLVSRSPETDERLRMSLCGYEGKLPKVCCEKLFSKIDLLPRDCGHHEFKKTLDYSTGLYDFPWMTLIAHKKPDLPVIHQCAGTIINSRYILTVAHCVVGQFLKGMKLVGVRVGEYDLRTELDCVNEPFKECESSIQDIEIEKVIAHKNYTIRPIVTNDIALLRLARDIDLTQKNAKPICLPLTPAQRGRNITNLNGKIAGWGFTDSGDLSPVLVSIDIPVVDSEKCRTAFTRPGLRPETMENKICAGEDERNSCAGDSGAPLMIKSDTDNDRLIQYGIVSYGDKVCGSKNPSVNVDVTKYIEWILENIEP